MITENLSTLKIHKLTQTQYDREKAAGNLDTTALYLTPNEYMDLSNYATKEELSKKLNAPSSTGAIGQLAVSDGNGGITWQSEIFTWEKYSVVSGTTSSAYSQQEVANKYGTKLSSAMITLYSSMSFNTNTGVFTLSDSTYSGWGTIYSNKTYETYPYYYIDDAHTKVAKIVSMTPPNTGSVVQNYGVNYTEYYSLKNEQGVVKGDYIEDITSTSSYDYPADGYKDGYWYVLKENSGSGSGSNIVVDSELSTTSTNPVQNKVITSKINSIESSLNQKANTSAIPTKTSQLTNNSGFLTSIPSEYVTETELTNKGYATQASVTALSNRIDNLPTGGNITVDSALSSTSTNPVQNKVIYEEFSKLEEALVKDFSDVNDGFNEVFGEIEAIHNEIDNLSASGGKTLIGEITLTSENVSKTDNNTLTFNDELKSQVAEIFEALDGFSGIIYIEEVTGDLVKTCVTTYVSGSTNMNVYKNLQYTIINNAINGTLQHVVIKEDRITTNNGSSLDYIVNGNISLTTKFYTISGGSGSGGGVQPDWNQNDSSAPDYIKNRPFYSEVETVFDDNVTTEIDEELPGVAIAEHPMTILDNETDLYEVTVDDIVYNYEIKDLQFLGNSYLFIRAMSEAQEMTVEELIEAMMQYDPAIGEIYAQLAINTGETFFILDDSTTDNPVTLFLTEEPETHHFIIKKTTPVKKLSSAMIDWVGGGAPSGLPEVTEEDNDKVLMVVDGKWVVGSITNGDEVYY